MNLKSIFEKHKSFILYVFFGVCTTIVNIIVYRVCFFALSIPNVLSTIIAWFFSVIFAFIKQRNRDYFELRCKQNFDFFKRKSNKK